MKQLLLSDFFYVLFSSFDRSVKNGLQFQKPISFFKRDDHSPFTRWNLRAEKTAVRDISIQMIYILFRLCIIYLCLPKLTPLDLTKTPTIRRTIRSSARTVNDLQSAEDHHWSSVQKFQKQKFIKSCLQVGLLQSDNFWNYLSTIY